MHLSSIPSLLCFLTLLSNFAAAASDPLERGIDTSISVSSSPGARGLFFNPAALGFTYARDGAEADFLGLFAPGARGDGGALGFAAGPLGFGWERLPLGARSLDRYSIAVGSETSTTTFIGHRLAFHRYSDGDSGNALDSGFQWRPSHFVAFGVVAQNWLRWNSSPSTTPHLALGFTVRATRTLEAFVDGATPLADPQSFQTWVPNAQIAWQPVPGMRMHGGYHGTWGWRFGLEFDWDRGAFFSGIQPDSGDRKGFLGAHWSSLLNRSALIPRRRVTLEIDQRLSETTQVGLFSKSRPTLLEQLERLRDMETDDTIGVVAIRIDSFPLGLASLEELMSAISRVRKSGKRVEAYLGSGGLKEYLLATTADRITMENQGELRFLGLKSEKFFFKGMFDKVGIQAQFVARGKFKAAPESFLQKESSQAHREAALQDLDTLHARLETRLREHRKFSSSLRELEKIALVSADRALDLGLIDGTGSWPEPRPMIDLEERTRRDEMRLRERIAVVHVMGNILDHRVRALNVVGERQTTPEDLERSLRVAVADPRTLGILLRVSSPGGEILASDRMAHLVEEAKRKKPIFVSMGDMAASGGYYLAAAADRIYAGPLTWTGSIGVFVGKFSAPGLFQWLGVNKETLSRSPYPTFFSEATPWKEPELQIVTRRASEYYDEFVAYAAKRRNVSVEQMEKSAQGRVWLGLDAKPRQLVDGLGGYFETAEALADHLEVARDDIELVPIQQTASLFSMFEPDILGASALGSRFGEELQDVVGTAEALERSPYLYWHPVRAAK